MISQESIMQSSEIYCVVKAAWDAIVGYDGFDDSPMTIVQFVITNLNDNLILPTREIQDDVDVL